MVTMTSPEEWWLNLSSETRDRLAADPGAPVPAHLWREVVAANGANNVLSPFRSIEDHVLRPRFVAYIQADNEALLARIVSDPGLASSPIVQKWMERARRRGLMG